MSVATGHGGAPELLLADEAAGLFPADWNPRSNELIYNRSSGEESEIWALPMTGERTPRPLVQGEGSQYAGAVSPDGRWIAYTSAVRGEEAVFVARLPNAEERWQVSDGEGVEPRWRGDGKELYYVRDRFIMAVAIETEPRFRAESPRALFAADIRWTSAPHYDVAADGQRILVNVNDVSAEPIRLVAGWPERVRAR
jgi:hypothetical protein